MKKFLKYTLFSVFVFFSFTSIAFAENAELKFCEQDGVLQTLKIVGICLYVLKIFVPILLMIFAMIDLGKSVISSDSDEIRKAVGIIVKRAIASIVIFLLPTLIHFAFTALVDNHATGFGACETCINTPGSCNGGN